MRLFKKIYIIPTETYLCSDEDITYNGGKYVNAGWSYYRDKNYIRIRSYNIKYDNIKYYL